MNSRLHQHVPAAPRSTRLDRKRFCGPWLLGVLALFALIAGTGAGAWATDIAGVVTDNSTGLPLANATVILWETGDTTTTNASGEYHFPVMPAGGGTIVIGSVGYGPTTRLATTCLCPYQGDMDQSTFLDANDLNDLIDDLFFGGADPKDPGCPTTRSDVNNDGFPDANDLNELIDHLFFGGAPPIDPCAP